jgi:hypothetical protein
MTDMVYAIADYHCATILFDALGALQAVHQQEDATPA